MLWLHLDWVCNGTLVLMGIVTACAIHAYYVDARRPDDDPKKKYYHPLGILLAPIALPLLLVVVPFFFLLRAITYGVFMTVFILALIFIRNAKIVAMIQNDAVYVGRLIMDVNATAIRILSWPWTGSREYA